VNRIGRIGLAIAGVLGLALTACTDMPPVTGYFPKGQPKLSSAQRWQVNTAPGQKPPNSGPLEK
jgi:hypothetical protein